MIADVRELLDPDLWVQGRKGLIYELEEAPEGHGGLPNPRYTACDVAIMAEPLYDPEDEVFFIREKAYRKEWRKHWSELEDGTLEITIYQVWVPYAWGY